MSDSNWPGYTHEILRFTSRRTGKQWVIDLTGGQYGIYQPFHTWTEYEKAYINTVKAVFDSGVNKETIDKLSKLPGLDSITYGLVGEAAKELIKAVEDWTNQNITLSKLISPANDKFNSQKEALLIACTKAVSRFVKTFGFNKTVVEAQIFHAKHHKQLKVQSDRIWAEKRNKKKRISYNMNDTGPTVVYSLY